ncbi:MAG TPA: NUDIX hydrolase [Terracidiphilus sp.]|jgi:ADP-ribose pyrophosphatase|nr:NUDIX hydrolase [Terracidiphilus sp.]
MAKKAKAEAEQTQTQVKAAKQHGTAEKSGGESPEKSGLKKSGRKESGKKKSGPKKSGKKKSGAALEQTVVECARVVSSRVVYTGPLFRVLHDKIVEPDGSRNERDVIRHNGSVVILAVDNSKSKKNPWIVIERQYRHAANQYLWELPAGKLDPGEQPLAGAQRELSEETGYSARKWKPLVEYFASPGFLGESMKVFLAEGLQAGDAHPEEDERIEFRLVKLSDVLKMIEKGAILDGKTLTSVLLYARMKGL